MADSKLTELTAATSVAAADQLYLVQSSTSKRVTAANVFGAIATPTVFGDKVSIGDHQTVTSAASGGTLTMTAGVEGQLKIIIMSSNTSAVTLTLDDSDLGHDTITFNNAGDTTTLIYAGSKWWSIGGSATIVN